MIQAALTVEQFLDTRMELPDAGQWTELIRGVAVSLEPPGVEHGDVVLNLSKAFSAYAHQHVDFLGYPCFDLGLLVERRPDTVFFPAACYFVDGTRFAEADREITDTVPQLVIEVLSTNDRRVNLHDRTSAYLQQGVPILWHVDLSQRAVMVCGANCRPWRVTEFEMLSGDDWLPGFSIRVGDLFAPPKWA